MDAPRRTDIPNQAAEIVPVSGRANQEGIFSFYAVLAYPLLNERAKRTEFVRALKAREWKKRVTGGKSEEQAPGEFCITNQKIVGQINKGYRQIGKRLSAGSMGYCMILSGARIPYDENKRSSGGVIIQAPGTVNKAAEKLQEDKDRGEDKKKKTKVRDEIVEDGISNIKSRIWTSSKPALHLAVAFHVRVGRLLNGMEAKPSRRNFELMLDALSHSENWLRETLAFAEKLRPRLPEKIPTFDPSKAVRLLFLD